MKTCLLLLPEPPTNIYLSSFRAAYGPALQSSFSKINKQIEEQLVSQVSLDICISCDIVTLSRDLPRSTSFAYVQSVLKQLYSLVAVILAEHSSKLDDGNLDIRIYVLDARNRGKLDQIPYNQGPIIALKTVAWAPRKWTTVFGVDGEAGETLLQAFISEHVSSSASKNQSAFNVYRVPGGSVVKLQKSSSQESQDDHEQSKQSFHHSIAVGGTFDHLHLGHKLLLTGTALALDPLLNSDNTPRVLTVGITTTALLLNKAHASVLESWSVREQSVIRFLTSILDLSLASHTQLRSERFDKDEKNGTAVHYTFPNNLVVRCVEIDDAYGPTITDKEIDALVVSAETRKGGAAVNEKRREKGWRELDVFEVNVLDAKPSEDTDGVEQDFKSKISSTEIRKRIEEKTRHAGI